MNKAKYFLSIALLALLSASTIAAPVTYTFTGNWTNAPTGDFGASYIATLVFDNGGSSAANQTFDQADFVSGRIVSGTYDFSVAPGDITSWDTDFGSNASGQLVNGWFNAQNSGNYWHMDLEFDDAYANNTGGTGQYFQTHVSNTGTVGGDPVAPSIPVPTMPLYGLLLTMFGVAMVAIRRLKH